MKKLLTVVSLAVFMAFSVNAEEPVKKSKDANQEVTKINSEVKATSHSCCVKANASCCKNNKESKACTAEQKAACAKAGKECTTHTKATKAKDEASATTPVPATSEIKE